MSTLSWEEESLTIGSCKLNRVNKERGLLARQELSIPTETTGTSGYSTALSLLRLGHQKAQVWPLETSHRNLAKIQSRFPLLVTILQWRVILS